MTDGAPWLNELPASCDCLREYQRRLIADTAAAMAAGSRRILVQAPTGSGKTHAIASITSAARAANLRVLILATRTRLVLQLHERLDAFGIAHGVIAAALPALNHRAAWVQVASVDTLYRRALVDDRTPLPAADVVIFDEAHLALGQSRIALLEQYPAATHFGFTATPAMVSGRPLRERFETLISGPTVKELISIGALVRTRIFTAPAATEQELAAVDKDSKTGDYVVEQLGELMSRPRLVGDVLQNWLRIANGKRTLVFACTKSHGAALLQEFLRAGIAAEMLTDQDSEPDREAAICRLETGTTKVLINCFLLSYGIDIPSVEAIVLARPTRSLTLYLQSVGRGMRPAPGKDHVIVIDHGRVVESLGMPDADFEWSLDEGNVNLRARSAAAARQDTPEEARTCPECSHIWLVSEDGPGCDACGWVPAPKAKPVAVIEAELREMNAAATGARDAEIEDFFRQALGYYARRWPDRWKEKPNGGRWSAWKQTCERFELCAQKPPSRFWSFLPKPADASTWGWLESRRIAYARARSREERAPV